MPYMKDLKDIVVGPTPPHRLVLVYARFVEKLHSLTRQLRRRSHEIEVENVMENIGNCDEKCWREAEVEGMEPMVEKW